MEHFMVELLVRGLVLCLLAALALLLLRRSAAAYRHLICVLALVALLILPLAQRLLPPLQLFKPSPVTPPARVIAPTEAARRSAPRNLSAGSLSSMEVPRPQSAPPESAAVLPPDNTSLPAPVAYAPPADSQERSRKATTILLTFWGLGTTTLLVRLMVALFRLRRLETDGREEILAGVPILVSARVDTPLTWGIRRHVILLPSALLSGDPAVCESALRHEQAHIARWDWLWNLLSEIICAFCWFQPGVWWLRRRMRLESERACDDRVLLSGIVGPDYAAHLLQILQSVPTREIAPAMANIGGMEERMKHILDNNRPRRTKRIWLAMGAPVALALLSFAALRVSARPAETKSLPAPGANILNSRRPVLSSQPSQPALPPADSSASHAAELPFSEPPPLSEIRAMPIIQPNALMAMAQPGNAPLQTTNVPADAPPLPGPVVPLDQVYWGNEADGLQPGLILNRPDPPSTWRVPYNSRTMYQILVRNATQEDRVFEVQCQNTDELDIPYLIPSDEIAQALNAHEIPTKFRAKGTSSPDLGLFPAYVVKLAPGEAVVMPGDFELYVGDAEKQRFPRIEEIKKGMNWIVQPITTHSLTSAEIAAAEASERKVTLTIADRAGKASQRSAIRLPARAGGMKLYAKIQLEVGTLNAEAFRNADKAVWGKVDNGIQCGIRLLNPQRAYRVGDTLEAELGSPDLLVIWPVFNA